MVVVHHGDQPFYTGFMCPIVFRDAALAAIFPPDLRGRTALGHIHLREPPPHVQMHISLICNFLLLSMEQLVLDFGTFLSALVSDSIFGASRRLLVFSLSLCKGVCVQSKSQLATDTSRIVHVLADFFLSTFCQHVCDVVTCPLSVYGIESQSGMRCTWPHARAQRPACTI